MDGNRDSYHASIIIDEERAASVRFRDSLRSADLLMRRP